MTATEKRPRYLPLPYGSEICEGWRRREDTAPHILGAQSQGRGKGRGSHFSDSTEDCADSLLGLPSHPLNSTPAEQTGKVKRKLFKRQISALCLAFLIAKILPSWPGHSHPSAFHPFFCVPELSGISRMKTAPSIPFSHALPSLRIEGVLRRDVGQFTEK